SPFPVPFFVAVFERLYSRQPHRNRAESHAHPRRHADIDERCHQLFLRVASAATCCWRCAICAWVCSLTTRGRTNVVWKFIVGCDAPPEGIRPRFSWSRTPRPNARVADALTTNSPLWTMPAGWLRAPSPVYPPEANPKPSLVNRSSSEPAASP